MRSDVNSVRVRWRGIADRCGSGISKKILDFRFQLIYKLGSLEPLEEWMTAIQAMRNIKDAINKAPRNAYVAELHVQIIKYADVLRDTTGREFTEEVGIPSSFGTEFLKMRKISARLQNAGLNTAKI